MILAVMYVNMIDTKFIHAVMLHKKGTNMKKKQTLAHMAIGFIVGYLSTTGFSRLLYYGTMAAAFVIGLLLGHLDLVRMVINGL